MYLPSGRLRPPLTFYLLLTSHKNFDIMILEEEFVPFHHTIACAVCLDVEESPRVAYTDEQAKKIIEKISKCRSISEFQALDKETRNKYLAKLREQGLSIRQISRLTGVNVSAVKRI